MCVHVSPGAGMVMVAWPILSGRASQLEPVSISEKTQAYTTSKNLLLNGADAVERIMTSYKEVYKSKSKLLSMCFVT